MANEKVLTSQALVGLFRQALDDHWGYIWGTAGVMWTQARQNQLDKTTDSNRELSRKYGKKWIGHMVADCSGLFCWAFRQYGLSMSHISSNIYKSYCSKKGQLTDALKKTLLPGTAVFTGSTASNHPHVGLYVGGGKVIEAHGTIKGVIESSITEKRWTWWGQLKNVDYSGEAQPEIPEKETQTAMRTLRRGNKGEDVKKVQTMLDKLGYSLGICGIDGDYGMATEKAVREFQRDHGLAQDGICGPKTFAALDDAMAKLDAKPAEEKYTVTIRGLSKEVAQEITAKYGGEMKAEA